MSKDKGNKKSIIYEANCIFCQICKEKQDQIKYEDEDYCAFDDIKPASTNHFVIVPKTHYKNILSLPQEELYRVKDLVKIGEKLLKDNGVDLNCARFGFHWPPFHSISHLHLHAIGPESEMGLIARGIFKKNSYWFVDPNTAIEYLEKKFSSRQPSSKE